MRTFCLTLAVLAAAASAPVVATAETPAVKGPLVDYLKNVPQDFQAITSPALKARLDAREKVFVLDVREPNEFAAGHIQGAVNLPIRAVGTSLDKLPAKDAPVVVVCRSGMRAAYVTMAMTMMGWTNVKDLAFGMTDWERQNLPTVK